MTKLQCNQITLAGLNLSTIGNTDRANQIKCQQSFLNMHFENDQKKMDTVNIEINDGMIVIRTREQIKDKNGVVIVTELNDHEVKGVNSAELRNFIIAEYHIFKHKYCGAELPENLLPQVLEMFEQYKTEARKYEYEAICFSGGGAKGLAYPGALEAIGEFRLNRVTEVSGASAGAITASFVACGGKTFEIEEFVVSNNLGFDQNKLIKLVGNKLLDIIKSRLLTLNLDLGIHTGDFELIKDVLLSFEEDDAVAKANLIKEVLSYNTYEQLTFKLLQKLKNTFKDLGFKDLYLNGTLDDKNNPSEIELSANTTPDMPIAIAVGCSAALPVVFSPIDITKYMSDKYLKDNFYGKKQVMAKDGGIMSNTPFHYLTPGKNILTLGFVDNKGVYNKEIGLLDKFIDYHIACANVASYERSDLEFLDKMNAIHYLDTKNVDTISIWDGPKQFNRLKNSVKHDFVDYECNRDYESIHLIKDKQLISHHNIFKYKIATKYYKDPNSVEGKLLHSKMGLTNIT
ncbi:MAG: patatin-like phospholipase family protein [Burkholderiales bacterium]|nr:patatin-like phospholipase family protein [Burkholderiales bacterium]